MGKILSDSKKAVMKLDPTLKGKKMVVGRASKTKAPKAGKS